jgi:hypothetical protein
MGRTLIMREFKSLDAVKNDPCTVVQIPRLVARQIMVIMDHSLLEWPGMALYRTRAAVERWCRFRGTPLNSWPDTRNLDKAHLATIQGKRLMVLTLVAVLTVVG